MSHTSNGKDQTEFDPATTHRIHPLIRALHAHEPEPISCAECRRHFADLYHLQRTDSEIPADYLPYQAHLSHCADCQTEFAALCKVLAEFEAGSLPEVAAMPVFDLSFMEDRALEDRTVEDNVQATTPAPTSSHLAGASIWLSTLAANLHNLAGDVVVMVERAKATFEPRPWLPKIELVPSPVLRSDQSAGGFAGQAELLVLPAPDADLSLHLSVGPVVAGAAAIAVRLSEFSSGRPLGETRVTLRNGQRQLLIGFVTNQEGTALFEQLALGRYFIQVRHSQQTWEIPLVLVEGTLAVGAQPAS